MKNVARILCLVLVSVLLCASLTACIGGFGGPAKDYKDAKAALKDADYDVAVYKGDKANSLMGTKMKNLEAVVEAYDEDYEEAILIFYFEDTDAAKRAWDKYDDEFEEIVDELEDEDFDVEFKRSGSIIYIGTENAVKDAR